VARTVRKLVASGKALVFVYEAGPCGFGIHRWLKVQGHECWVVSPSLTPKKPGERIKTDTRDAVKLARLARAGELTAIYVPEAADEALRDLVRAREDAVAMQRQARHRLQALLLRNDIRYVGKSAWDAGPPTLDRPLEAAPRDAADCLRRIRAGGTGGHDAHPAAHRRHRTSGKHLALAASGGGAASHARGATHPCRAHRG
jgi:transposase